MKFTTLALLIAGASAQDAVVGTQKVDDSCNPNGKTATDGCVDGTARCARASNSTWMDRIKAETEK